jgi:hypothetical protein
MKNETLQNTMDTISSSEWPWPDSLDALVAAPRHHRRIFENDRVRVLEVRIPRRETVPVHTHRWPGVLHLQSWSEHVRRDEAGKLIFDSREAGAPPATPSAIWCDPLPPHSVENVGEDELRVLSIELKGPVADASGHGGEILKKV